MQQSPNKTKPYEFRKLEDLNVIDNFLFQQMISDEECGPEFARILLQTILGKPIRKVKVTPQKNILGIDTDKHGIRMDAQILSNIYDLEPNQEYEKATLPKRMRYYHGLIDTQLLSAGSGYHNLPNVVIIVILPYDPFDQNRMVYTVRNGCIEDSTVEYDDGARKIFLYTKGKSENAGQPLKDMLKYIQDSTDSNVTNEDIATVRELVNKVKHKKEVGISYMKSWEYEQMIHDKAQKAGFESDRG